MASNTEYQWSAAASVKLSEGATAVDMVEGGLGDLLLAVGAESGNIGIYSISRASKDVEAKLVREIDTE